MSTLGKNIANEMKAAQAKKRSQMLKTRYDDEEEKFEEQAPSPSLEEEDPASSRFGRLKRILGIGPKVASR